MRRVTRQITPRVDEFESRFLLSADFQAFAPVAANSTFLKPVDRFGDVANRMPAPGGNDSSWVGDAFTRARSQAAVTSDKF